MPLPLLIPPILVWSGVGLAGAGGFKLLSSGVEDLSDSTLKLAGAAVLGIAGYIALKRIGLI